MRKIKLFSFFLIAGLMFVCNVNKVFASCYLFTNSDGKTSYVTAFDNWMITGGSKVEKVSDVYCGIFSSCASYNELNSKSEREKKCESSENPKCVWNSEYEFCSVTGLTYLKCGDAKDIPPVVPKLTSYAVNLLKILTPIILILIGIIELVKAMASSNEDSMKKAQSKLIKKVAAAVMVFFVITIVQFVILKVADSGETGSIKKCLKCFLNNSCDGSTYYKDGYGMCYYLNGDSKPCDNI